MWTKIKKLSKKFFTKKILIFRWQLNLFATICVSIGMMVGIYIGVDRLQYYSALDDTIISWEYNTDNIPLFTYDPSLVLVNAQNTTTGINRITNGTFDTDLAGWDYSSSYLLNDQFTTDMLAGTLNGTAAEPTGGNRTIYDPNNKISITSSALNIATGVSSYTGVWYPSQAREGGKVLYFKVTPSNTSGYIDVGWDIDSSGTINNKLRFGVGISVIENGGSGINIIGGYTTTTYDVALVMRPLGNFWFIKGGIYSTWTLLWTSSAGNAAGIPALNVNSLTSGVAADDIKIPIATWLPTPLAYDPFDTDGSTATSTTGPDGQPAPQLPWTGSTWNVSGGTINNTPSTGNEIVVDGGFENWTSPTDLSNWTETLVATSTVNQEATTVHTGNNAVRLDINETSNYAKIGQIITAPANSWITASYWTRKLGSSGGGVIANIRYPMRQDPTTSWQQFNTTQRNPNSNPTFLFQNIYLASNSVYIDDVSAKVLTINTLFRTVQITEKEVLAEVNLKNYNPSSQMGLVLNLDSTSDPSNYVILYLETADGNNKNVILAKVVNGVYSSINSSGISFTTDGQLKVIRQGDGYSVYFNNAYKFYAAVSDAGIVNNTIHGLFSTDSGNTFDNYALWAQSGYALDGPIAELLVTQDTNIKYSGTASAKLVAPGSNKTFLQSINVGDTSTYNISAYVYTNGSAVTSSDVELYHNNTTIASSFTPIDNGWYFVSGSVQGTASPVNYGLQIKASKTVYVDNLMMYKQGTYQIFNTTAYFNQSLSRLDSFRTVVNTPGNSTVKFQLCPDEGAICESANSWQYWNGSAWTIATNATTHTNLASELTNDVVQQFNVTNKKISVKAFLVANAQNFPSLTSVSLGMTTDSIAPNNATDPLFIKANGDRCNNVDNCWTSQAQPSFEWTAGSDANSGMYGYCLYFGTDANGNPLESKGKLGTSPETLANTPCNFIVSTPSLDLSVLGYLSTALSNEENFISEQDTYFLNIVAIDQASNVSEDRVSIKFRYDGVRPTNVTYISTPSGNFSNVADMSFTWPITGNGISTDSNSQIMGWQYQLNSTIGDWKGPTHSSEFNIDYIPLGGSTYQLTAMDRLSINMGNNIIYFRTVDNVGLFSTDTTIRSGNLAFGGEAPVFDGTDKVTITPDSNDINNFSLAWPPATPSTGQTVTHYYYSINTQPAGSIDTLQNNIGAYLDNENNLSVATAALPNVIKGLNTVYVVAIDDADPPSYSPSNFITGTFTLNSTNPDSVGNLVASDSSIKVKSRWNVALTWIAPVYQGAGNLNYLIYRSTNGIDFTQVGSSTGLSYVDNTPESIVYYYKVVTKDGANALSSGTSTVMIIPTGKWTTPAELDSEPGVTSVSSKQAVISWTTERSADSKIAFGTNTGEYLDVEPSTSDQVTGHSIKLSGLDPGTIYYYIAKWTDEDGNTGKSEESVFQTLPPPTVKNVILTNVGIDNAFIKFTTTGANSAKVYFGQSTSFGGLQELATSPVEATYSVQITGLNDGTKYYYRINALDEDKNEYNGTILDFTTLPRPKISDVSISEVTNTAQTTMMVQWESNTEVSSIVHYYPEGQPELGADVVDITPLKGSHKMILRGLQIKTKYAFIIKGVDKLGNEAISDTNFYLTSTDSRPPLIYDLTTQGTTSTVTTSSSQSQFAQLIVTWNTDEPSTSQVEFSEGTGDDYSQKTLEDSNLTYNHVIVITNLTPSKVYHLRAISKDSAGNINKSLDTVTITPKSTENALNLVLNNLRKIFGF